MAKKLSKGKKKRDSRKGTSSSAIQPSEWVPNADQILWDLANGLRDLDERVGVLEH